MHHAKPSNTFDLNLLPAPGARDLEESIGISLSARRYEVNRLELTLSIGSFSAAIGALVAGIFGESYRGNPQSHIGAGTGTTCC